MEEERKTHRAIEDLGLRDGGRVVGDDVERERRRIARDLHDGLGQDLAWVTLVLRTLLRRARLTEPDRRELSEVTATVQHLAGRVRQISHELHPARVEILGLSGALCMLGRDLERHHGIAVDLDLDSRLDQVAQPTGRAAYRVAQEALVNAARHARTSEIRLKAYFASDCLVLIVEDEGVGLNLSEAYAGPGLGLITMRERVRDQGGGFLVQSRPGLGTRVEVSFPHTGVPDHPLTVVDDPSP